MQTTTDPKASPKPFLADDGRTHLPTQLMRESLVSHALGDKLASEQAESEEVSLLPWAKLINIGGSSVLDRGARALLPLLDEVVKQRADHHMIVSVGAGARMHHTFEIAQSLNLPIGGLAQLVGAVEEQNAHMVHAIMSRYGGISMSREHFSELPKYLLTGMTPIIISMPPYHYWEPPPIDGDLPENGSDLGAFVTAEVLGVQQLIFIKDQEGHFDRNPTKHDDAVLLEECKVADLMKLADDDLILERAVLRALNRARHVRQIHVINGLDATTLGKALNGEKVGTIIHQD